MSITNEDTRIVFVGDGSDNSPYAISFPLRAGTSVGVRFVTDSTGAEVLKAIITDYTIAVATDFGSATLTLVTTAPATGETMVITREEPATRLSSYSNFDGQPSSTMNSDYDKSAMATQTMQEQMDRALVVAKGHPDASLPLTPLNMIGNAGAGLIVNSAEDDWEFTDGTFIDGSGTLNTIPLWTPDGSTLGDSIIAQSSSLITVAGTLTVNSDTAGTTILGRAKIGSTATNDDVAAFAHFDFFDATNFALEQSNLGHVRVNAPSSRSVSITIADTSELTVEGSLVNIPSNDFRVTLGDVDILAGALTVVGTITAGSGATVITTAAGLLRHQAIDPAIAGAGITATSGVLSVTSGLAGSGTLNAIPLWTPDGSTLGDSALTQSAGNLTASGRLQVNDILSCVGVEGGLTGTNVGDGVTWVVSNSDDSSVASHAKLSIATEDASGGNPYVLWGIGVVAQEYTMGIDNADSDKFVGSASITLGTANWLEVTTAGAVLLTGVLSAGSGSTVLTTAAGLLRHQAIDPAIAGSGITNTSGVLSVAAPGVGTVAGTGTAGTITKWAAGGADIEDSVIVESVGQIGIGVTPLADLHIDMTAASTLSTLAGSVFLQAFSNSGDGNFGAGIVFGQPSGANGPTIGASIMVVQRTADTNAVGLDFSVHGETGIDPRFNALRLDHLGNVEIPNGNLTVTLNDMNVLAGDLTVSSGTLSVTRNETTTTAPVAKIVQDHDTVGGPVLELQQDTVIDAFVVFTGSDLGVISSGDSSLKSVRVEHGGTIYLLPLYANV